MNREQFDIWYWSNIGDENKPVIVAAWEAWQARPSYVEVELPESRYDYESIDVFDAPEVRDALKAQGIKVKQ